MELFRKLASNIFFKLVIGVVIISFTLFGISGFLLGNTDNWVAKVGNKTIGQREFINAMKNDRELIMANNKSTEAIQYLDSAAFQNDVLKRMVNRLMIEKLQDDYQVKADRKAILQSVVRDPSFKNKEGKFDQALFESFLSRHSLNEEKYINEIANEITASMIVQSLLISAPLNLQSVLDQENLRKETRIADLITLTTAQVSSEIKPSPEDLKKFFESHKEQYFTSEIRKISYLSFGKKDFSSDFKISDNELRAEYEKNKDQFLIPETRNFYHLVFDKKDEATEFAANLSKSDLKADFAKQAKLKKNKDLKAIYLKNLAKKDFIPELVESAFSLKIGEISQPIESSLGFHIFLVTEIQASKPLSFEQSKDSIKSSLLKGREEKVIQEKMSQIDDALVSAKSLKDVADKILPSAKIANLELSQQGLNQKGELVSEAKEFTKFVENAFSLQKGQNSKIYHNDNFDKFYVIRAEEIIPARQKQLEEVRAAVEKEFINYKKSLLLIDLAKKVGEELKANPQKLTEIAAKYNAKIEKNRELPRSIKLNQEGGLEPYRNKILDELFSLKIGESTNFIDVQNQVFIAAVLRQIKTGNIASSEYEQAKNIAAQQFRNEIMQEFDRYLSQKNKVKVNEKIFSKSLEGSQE